MRVVLQLYMTSTLKVVMIVRTVIFVMLSFSPFSRHYKLCPNYDEFFCFSSFLFSLSLSYKSSGNLSLCIAFTISTFTTMPFSVLPSTHLATLLVIALILSVSI
jgi:hypothetical protein